MQQFPKIDKQKMMDVVPNNLVENHINNFQSNHQHQIVRVPMQDKNLYHILNPTETK